MNLDYVAGIFDGEGWFHINKAPQPTRLGHSFQVHAALAIRQRKIVVLLRGLFGGSVRKNVPKNPKHSISWRWQASGETVFRFAQLVRPLLLIKHRQAALAIKFQAYKRLNKNSPNSDARHKRLERMYLNMKKLNRKGPTC